MKLSWGLSVALVATTHSVWALSDNTANTANTASLLAFDPATSDILLPTGSMSLANPLLADTHRPDNCPPCFNCLLDAFPCSHFAPCNPYDGRCSCPPGFAGDNCSVPGTVLVCPCFSRRFLSFVACGEKSAVSLPPFFQPHRVLVATMHSSDNNNNPYPLLTFAPPLPPLLSVDSKLVVECNNIPVPSTFSLLNKVLSLDHAGPYARRCLTPCFVAVIHN